MDRPTITEIRAEAIKYLADFDKEIAATGKGYYHDRSAHAVADFLLESKFAGVDEDCDWPEDFCQYYFDTAKDALKATA